MRFEEFEAMWKQGPLRQCHAQQVRTRTLWRRGGRADHSADRAGRPRDRGCAGPRTGPGSARTYRGSASPPASAFWSRRFTKRLAEDLSTYIQQAGFRGRYLHSEVDTLERVEILRDLRQGEFDVLVGVNLLREGLDLPEVSLVAILDADKEGLPAFRRRRSFR
jgi:hypothetical protein